MGANEGTRRVRRGVGVRLAGEVSEAHPLAVERSQRVQAGLGLRHRAGRAAARSEAILGRYVFTSRVPQTSQTCKQLYSQKQSRGNAQGLCARKGLVLASEGGTRDIDGGSKPCMHDGGG